MAAPPPRRDVAEVAEVARRDARNRAGSVGRRGPAPRAREDLSPGKAGHWGRLPKPRRQVRGPGSPPHGLPAATTARAGERERRAATTTRRGAASPRTPARSARRPPRPLRLTQTRQGFPPYPVSSGDHRRYHHQGKQTQAQREKIKNRRSPLGDEGEGAFTPHPPVNDGCLL